MPSIENKYGTFETFGGILVVAHRFDNDDRLEHGISELAWTLQSTIS
jgi:hypothetical protein